MYAIFTKYERAIIQGSLAAWQVSIFRNTGKKPRLPDLKNKTVCELSDGIFKSGEIFPRLRELLSKQYPGIKFIPYTNFGNIHGSKETDIISNLADQLHSYGCDAVISGVGG